ncbi:MAG: alkaline phosphatase family protein, partial [Chloroflexota bacterium]|nr:alkaline phosphatase family protein [Chloroflexota bacterium]
MRPYSLLLIVALTISCTLRPAATTTASPTPSDSPSTPSPTPTETPTPSTPHVFVIVMENSSLATALRSPSIERLAATYALATNYRAVSSPSLPNYLAMTSGSTWGITDDAYHVLPAGGLGAQLTAAGVSWRAYMEGLTSAGCLRSPYPYALKHNPFAYYGGSCPENVVALDALDADLARDTPSVVWVTPGLCHDGHDCALSEAGPWLEDLVRRIVDSSAWRDHGALFVVWDEGDGRSSVVPLIVASPDVESRRVDGIYDHYSLLAAIEDQFGLPRLGAAKDARPLTDLL